MSLVLKGRRALDTFLLRRRLPDDALTAFLSLARQRGVRLQFPPHLASLQERENALARLLQPLTLSDEERHRLLEHSLRPLSVFDVGPSACFTAIHSAEPLAFPCQLCKRCAPGLFDYYGGHLSQRSWCSQCHHNGACIDAALIEHYRQCGIEEDTIVRQLPKARWGLRGEVPSYQSITAIENAYPLAFQTPR